MPFINSYLSTSLNEGTKTILKMELGKIIQTIPGKTEAWLMINLSDNQTMYFQGDSKECAYIEVKIYGKADHSYKTLLVKELTECFHNLCSMPKENIYVTVQELKDWSWNGSLL
jgi:phenylpyruvate tautomerase PptA (4-oxalocrotonate tautomerase family)